MDKTWIDRLVEKNRRRINNVAWLEANYDVIDNELESFIHIYPRGSAAIIQETELEDSTPEKIKLLVEERINHDARP